MNIIKFELNYYKKQLFIYATILSLVLIIFISGLYPTFSSDLFNLTDLLKQMPPEVMKGFSISLDSFSTITGFYVYTGNYVLLILSIYAINVSINIFNKEYIKNKSEFIFTKPVSKDTIFKSKLITVFILNIIIWLIQFIVSIILGLLIDASTFYLSQFIEIQLCFIMIQFACIAISLIIQSFKIKKLNSVTIGFLVGFLLFFIDIIVKILENDILKYLSIYSYVDISSVINNGLNVPSLGILSILIISSIVISYKIYQRKDILL